MSSSEQKTYNVLPGPRMGVVTPEYLEALAAAARKHQVPFIKLTSAQRFAIAGHSPEAAAGVWNALGHADGPKKPTGIHYVQACPGVRWCKYGRQDSLALGEKLQESLLGRAFTGQDQGWHLGLPDELLRELYSGCGNLR